MTTRARSIHAGALLALCAAGAALASSPAQAPKRNVGGPADYGLYQRIVATLRRDPELSHLPVQVAMVNGGVVFSGEVPSCALKMRMLRLAAATTGIINVTDSLRVTTADLPDAALRKGIESALRDAAEQMGLKDFSATVEDSVGTLEGTVESFQARVQAEEIAGKVQGLTRIVNHLRPANAPAGTDDPSVAKAVVEYLGDFRNYGFPAEIEVAAAGGVVTLTGRVGLFLARQQAGVAASLVGGVTRVDNRLKVDPGVSPFVGGRGRATSVKVRS